MADIVFLLVTFGFFALCTLLVRACDGIIGPEPQDTSDPQVDDRDLDEVSPVSADNILGLVLALGTALYLVAALVWPERF